MNVTEVLDSDFKNAFSGIFNFTVGILRRINRDRQRLVQHLDGSGPSTALESPQLTESSSAEEAEDRRQKTRQKNSKRQERSLISL